MDKWIYGTVGVLIGAAIGAPVGVYYGYKWSLGEIRKYIPIVTSWDEARAWLAGASYTKVPGHPKSLGATAPKAPFVGEAKLGDVVITQNGVKTTWDTDAMVIKKIVTPGLNI